MSHRPSDNIEIHTIWASFFLFQCQVALNRRKEAWIDLRQAITFALALNLHKEENYGHPDSRFVRNLFWTLFIEDR